MLASNVHLQRNNCDCAHGLAALSLQKKEEKETKNIHIKLNVIVAIKLEKVLKINYQKLILKGEIYQANISEFWVVKIVSQCYHCMLSLHCEPLPQN